VRLRWHASKASATAAGMTHSVATMWPPSATQVTFSIWARGTCAFAFLSNHTARIRFSQQPYSIRFSQQPYTFSATIQFLSNHTVSQQPYSFSATIQFLSNHTVSQQPYRIFPPRPEFHLCTCACLSVSARVYVCVCARVFVCVYVSFLGFRIFGDDSYM